MKPAMRFLQFISVSDLKILIFAIRNHHDKKIFKDKVLSVDLIKTRKQSGPTKIQKLWKIEN
jgi:hypothetical protein